MTFRREVVSDRYAPNLAHTLSQRRVIGYRVTSLKSLHLHQQGHDQGLERVKPADPGSRHLDLWVRVLPRLASVPGTGRLRDGIEGWICLSLTRSPDGNFSGKGILSRETRVPTESRILAVTGGLGRAEILSQTQWVRYCDLEVITSVLESHARHGISCETAFQVLQAPLSLTPQEEISRSWLPNHV